MEKDIIIHTTTTNLSFIKRIRVLFGKPIIITSKIYTDHEECKVIKSEASDYVPSLFPKKEKGGFENSVNTKKK